MLADSAIHMPYYQQEACLLQTKRLLIRPFQMKDLDALVPILSDLDATAFIGGPLNRSEVETQLQHWLTDFEKDGFGFMAFVDREQNELIGYGGFLHQIVDGKKFVELGYVIAKSYWGQGLATEVAFALKEYGLNVLQFPELISIIHTNNIASQRIASKIGMSLLKETEIEGSPCQIYYCSSRKG